ncbi:hypothetical protein ACI2KR_31115 [Pseudomonas luteola]
MFGSDPTYNFLKSIRVVHAGGVFFGESLHPNVYAYKYYWWVFHEGSPCEGKEFLTEKYRLTTAEAMALIETFKKEQTPHIVYNRKRPRLPSERTPPWDVNSARWANTVWAPRYEDDADPEHNGHK